MPPPVWKGLPQSFVSQCPQSIISSSARAVGFPDVPCVVGMNLLTFRPPQDMLFPFLPWERKLSLSFHAVMGFFFMFDVDTLTLFRPGMASSCLKCRKHSDFLRLSGPRLNRNTTDLLRDWCCVLMEHRSGGDVNLFGPCLKEGKSWVTTNLFHLGAQYRSTDTFLSGTFLHSSSWNVEIHQ